MHSDMPDVETDSSLQAGTYNRTLNYTFDESLRHGQGAFYYVFDEGGLRCSEAAESYGEVCLVAPEEMNAIARELPSFLYLDCGAWADNTDGHNTRRRDFGLICGPHVYLCEFTGGSAPISSSVPNVRRFFESLAARGCAGRVLKHGRILNPAATTATDPSLYLFVPDSHMPPASWFHYESEVSAHLFSVPSPIPIPDWMESLPVVRRQTDHYYRNLYSLVETNRRAG